MAKVYRVYDVNKNEFVSDCASKDQAIQRVDDICSIDQVTGLFEVHELDEGDTQLNPVVVYSKRA